MGNCCVFDRERVLRSVVAVNETRLGQHAGAGTDCHDPGGIFQTRRDLFHDVGISAQRTSSDT